MKTTEKILKYLSEHKQASVKELVDYLEISRMAVSNQLSNLVFEKKLVKIGKPPRVFYLLSGIKIEDAGEEDLNRKN